MAPEQLSLPLFEKRRPAAARLKLNGLSADAYSAYSLGSTVYVVVEAVIGEVDFVEDPKVGMMRVHKAKILRHCPAPDAEIAFKQIDDYEQERAEATALAEDPLGALSGAEE